MRRICVALVVLCPCAIAVVAPQAATAGRFSTPTPLPRSGSEWLFALNDRGQAIASPGGSLLYPVSSSGRLGSPWRLAVPGGFPASIGSIALDARGRVAVGATYDDRNYEPLGPQDAGCCEHVAAASWLFGARPPTAQILSTTATPFGYSEGTLGHPQVSIGSRAVTVLWAGENVPQFPEGSSADLDEAFGAFGGPLATARVLRVRPGIGAIHLGQAANGTPLAAWFEQPNRLRTARGARSGKLMLAGPARILPISEDDETQAFSSDFSGDTFFSYRSGDIEAPTQRWMVSASRRGQPFGRSRQIARVGLAANTPPALVAGGRGRLLATWECPARTHRCRGMRGRSIDIFGRLDAAFRVGAQPRALIDAQGRTEILYRRGPSVYALAAKPGRSFGRPQRVSPPGRRCTLGLGVEEAQQEVQAPLAVSPGGASLFYLTCREGHSAKKQQLLVRYTP
jgi:hypothetical protein